MLNKTKRNNDDIFIYENEIRPWLPNKIFEAYTHTIINQELKQAYTNAVEAKSKK